MSDAINPKHYKVHPSGIEAIEVTRHESFNIGNCLKYIWRHKHKKNAIEDLKKARWYLDDEIKKLEKEHELTITGPEPTEKVSNTIPEEVEDFNSRELRHNTDGQRRDRGF